MVSIKRNRSSYWKYRYELERQNPIHFLKRFLVKKEVEKITKNKKLSLIGDIGCGLGILAEELSGKSNKIYGYDLNKEIIKQANNFSSKPNIRFYSDNLFNIRKIGEFDLIIMTEVLEYIKDDIKALEKARSLLKPEGFVIITVPIREELISEFEEREGAIRYEAKELIKKIEKLKFKILVHRFWGYPLTNLFYSRVLVSASNKKAASKNEYPSYTKLVILLFKILKYFFLADLLFNSQKSFDLLLVIQKINAKAKK